MCKALLLTLTLAHAPACPAAPGPALFTEANGARALVTLSGETRDHAPSIFATPGRVAAGVEWGPAYLFVDKSVHEADASAQAGLRLRF
jgi:hypothetical protein